MFAGELAGIIRGLPLSAGMRVLDVACGDGFYTRQLSGRLGPRGTVTGVDIDCRYLAAASAAVVSNAMSATIAPHLEAALLDQLRDLVNPHSPRHLLRQPHLTMTWLSVLALGRKPPT